MQPNFILVGFDDPMDFVMYGRHVMITIKQFRPCPAPARSVQLRAAYKDDQHAGEALRTLGYLRLAERINETV